MHVFFHPTVQPQQPSYLRLFVLDLRTVERTDWALRFSPHIYAYNSFFVRFKMQWQAGLRNLTFDAVADEWWSRCQQRVCGAAADAGTLWPENWGWLQPLHLHWPRRWDCLWLGPWEEGLVPKSMKISLHLTIMFLGSLSFSSFAVYGPVFTAGNILSHIQYVMLYWNLCGLNLPTLQVFVTLKSCCVMVWLT